MLCLKVSFYASVSYRLGRDLVKSNHCGGELFVCVLKYVCVRKLMCVCMRACEPATGYRRGVKRKSSLWMWRGSLALRVNKHSFYPSSDAGKEAMGWEVRQRLDWGTRVGKNDVSVRENDGLGENEDAKNTDERYKSAMKWCWRKQGWEKGWRGKGLNDPVAQAWKRSSCKTSARHNYTLKGRTRGRGIKGLKALLIILESNGLFAAHTSPKR